MRIKRIQVQISLTNMAKCSTEKANIIAFRASSQEIMLLDQLKGSWQLNDFSKVLHRILSSYSGVMAERDFALSKIKADIAKWNFKDHELK
jgi:hypothetical protein